MSARMVTTMLMPAVVYLAFLFILLEPNPLAWHSINRVIFLAFCVFASAMCASFPGWDK